MDIPVEVWLRGDVHATTHVISTLGPDPGAWGDEDVTEVLTAMLRTLDRCKNPEADPDRPIALRGFSWIVNPYETGGVVIAIELTLGAVVAGPFDIAESVLSAMVQRVVDSGRAAVSTESRSDTIH